MVGNSPCISIAVILSYSSARHTERCTTLPKPVGNGVATIETSLTVRAKCANVVSPPLWGSQETCSNLWSGGVALYSHTSSAPIWAVRRSRLPPHPETFGGQCETRTRFAVQTQRFPIATNRPHFYFSKLLQRQLRLLPSVSSASHCFLTNSLTKIVLANCSNFSSVFSLLNNGSSSSMSDTPDSFLSESSLRL